MVLQNYLHFVKMIMKKTLNILIDSSLRVKLYYKNVNQKELNRVSV